MAKVQTPFEKLSPEKQQVVKQLYVTAQSLLAQGRYELARQEVIKLHQIIPYYEDSKQIEDTATQGLTMLAEREKAEADERQRAITEEKIQRQVAECRAQMKPNADMAWVESCLSPVMEFNPDHPAMLALKSQVERMINERIMKEQADKEYQKKVGELRALYAKAQKIEKVATPLNAISAYDRVVASKLPDPGGLQHKARREIASIQDSMLQKQVAAEQQADTAYHSGQLRRAIVIVREGLIINPDNEVLKGKLTQYLGELRKQMMGFYQEAIIEESLGEVESAKSRWKKIMDLSLPGEDYYEKAKMKLKKYGSL